MMIRADGDTDTTPPDFIDALTALDMLDARVSTRVIEERCFPSDQRSIILNGRFYCQLRRSITSQGQIYWGPEEEICKANFKNTDSLRRHYQSKHMGCPRRAVKKREDGHEVNRYAEQKRAGDGSGRARRSYTERTRKESRSKFSPSCFIVGIGRMRLLR